MIALFELFLRLTCIYDIRRKMQIYGAHDGLLLIILSINNLFDKFDK